MQGKHGIILAGALVALAVGGAALILSMGAPSSTPTALPDTAAPVGDPNAVIGGPPETTTAGNSTTNSSQGGTTAPPPSTTAPPPGGFYGP